MIVTLHCPSCEQEARPSFMAQAKLFVCSGCGQTLDRRELIERRQMTKYLAGLNTYGINIRIASVATFYDASAGSGSNMVVNNVVLNQGEVAITCLLGGASPAAPVDTGVTFVPPSSGSQDTTAGQGTPNQHLLVGTWFKVNAGSGSHTVTVVWDKAWTAGVVAILGVSNIKRGNLVFDQFAVGSDTGTLTNVSLVPAGAPDTNGELAIVTVGREVADTTAAIAWQDGYKHLLRAGTHAGGAASDVCLDIGYKILNVQTAPDAHAVLPTSGEWASSFSTYRPV